MNIRKRIALLLAIIMIISISLVGCNSNTKTTTSNNNGPKVNTKRVYREIGSWPKPPLYQNNPFGAGGIGYPISSCLYDSLYQYTRSTDKVIPRMADGLPTINGNQMIVKLKPNIKWSDGQPFTSKDIWAYFMLNNGCEIMKYLKDVQTPDDNTVVFIWNNPAPIDKVKVLLLAQEGAGTIPYHYFKQYVDKAAKLLKTGKPATQTIDRGALGLDILHNKTLGDALTKNWTAFIKISPKTPICTGPFILKTVTASDMILVKNEDYYNAKNIQFNTILFKQAPDMAGQYAMLKTGQLDRYDGTQTKDITTSILASNKNLIHYMMYNPADVGMTWNIRKYPLNDVNFRRAITYIFDREKIKDVGNYYAKAIDGYSAMGMPLTFVDQWVPQDIKDNMTKFTHDENKAADLLSQLGWKQGSDGNYKDKSGKLFNFILGATSSDTRYPNTAEIAAEQMKKFGLPAKLISVDPSIFYTNATNGKYDASAEWIDVTWSFDIPYFPFANFYEWNPGKWAGMPMDTKTGWNAVKAKGADGKIIEIGPYLHSMLYMSEDDMKIAAGNLTYIANENAYGLDFYQDFTGTWYNMNTVKFKNGFPMADQIKKSNRNLLPPTNPKEIQAVAETNFGFCGIQTLTSGDVIPN